MVTTSRNFEFRKVYNEYSKQYSEVRFMGLFSALFSTSVRQHVPQPKLDEFGRGVDASGYARADNTHMKSVSSLNSWQQLAVDHMLKSMNYSEALEYVENKSDLLGCAKLYPVPIEKLEQVIASTEFKVTDARTGQRMLIKFRSNIASYLRWLGFPDMFSAGAHNHKTFGTGENTIMKESVVDTVLQMTIQQLSIEGNRREVVALTNAVVTPIEN